MTMDYTSEMRLQQHQNIATIFKNESSFDLTFIVGEEKTEFHGSRVAMASLGDPFRVMLFGAMKESQSDTDIIIEDIDPNGFQSVLHWAHCRDPEISLENVVSVKSICRQYQISDLSALCDTYFTSCLSAQTFCFLFVESRNYKLNEYVQKCIDSLNGPFWNQIHLILGSDGFMEMELESMQCLLQLGNLCIAEETIWDAIMRWKNHKPQSTAVMDQNEEGLKREIDAEPPSKRRKTRSHNNKSEKVRERDLRGIVPFIRFGLMDHKYFVQNVQPTGCLNREEMLVISNYIAMRDTDPQFECGQFSTIKRQRGMDQRLKLFRKHFVNGGFEVLNGGLELKGNTNRSSCNGYGYGVMVYPMTSEQTEGVRNGVHFWSVLVVNVGCPRHDIGVVQNISINNDMWTNVFGGHGSSGSWHVSGVWNEGDIITVVLDCNKGIVQYFKNNDKLNQGTIAKGSVYFFAMRLCDTMGHQHYRVVQTPIAVLQACS